MPAPAWPKAVIENGSQNGDAASFVEWFQKDWLILWQVLKLRARNPGHDSKGKARRGDGPTRAIYRDDKNNTCFRERRGGESGVEGLAWAMCFSAKRPVRQGNPVQGAGVATRRPVGLHGSGIYSPRFGILGSTCATTLCRRGRNPRRKKQLKRRGELGHLTRTEYRAPTSGEMPATFLETSATPLACPLPLTTEALPEPANGPNEAMPKA